MKKLKRILAILGVAILAGLYLMTLFFAFFDASTGMVFFKASVICTIVIPVLLWAYMLIYRLSGNSKEETKEDAKKYQ